MPIVATYFFQAELGESEDSPNAFTLPLAAPITLEQFVRHFPPIRADPESKLHFRFRARDKNYQYVWVDVVSKEAEVPLYNGIVSVKVLRTDSAHACKRYSRLRRKETVDRGVDGANAAWKSRSEQGVAFSDVRRNSESPRTEKVIADDDQRWKQPSPTQTLFTQQPSPKLLSVSPPTSVQVVSTPIVDIFDFSDTPSVKPMESINNQFAADAQAPSKFDIDESTSSEWMQTMKEVPAQVPVQLDRADLAAKREAQVEEKVHRALEEKQERDDLQRKESDGIEAARLQHDASLTEWAFDASKKKRNMRTLLTTMHKVLWEGNKWKEIGLGDVLQPKQVKVCYRKAMLVIHPDRLAGESPERRFIAKRVFEAINEQYQDFLKSESVDA
jgi:hypothetical protein